MPTENETNSQNGQTDASAAPQGQPDVNAIVNSAITAHLKRFAEKQLPGILSPMLESAFKPIQEKLAAAPVKEADSEESGSKKTKISPETQALTAQLEEMRAKFADSEKKAAAAEQKARDDGARAALRDALGSKVRPELLNMLTDNLYHMKKVVEFDENGQPLFKSRKVDAFGFEEEALMPLSAGVEHYLKSEEAKAFLPAPSSASAQPIKKPIVGAGRTQPFDASTASTADKVRMAIELANKAERAGG